jgi:two-component system cell cycle sensor histidine kinase/response regulator CckA
VSHQSPDPSESGRPDPPVLPQAEAQARDGLQRRVVELEVMLAERDGALREGEQPVERLPDVVARFDRRRRLVYVSPSVETASGLPPDALIGRTILNIAAPPDLVALWDAALRRVIETAQADSIEFSYPAPDGQMRHYESTLIPEPAQDGSVCNVVAVTRDVSPHRQSARALRESESTYRHLVEVAGEGIWAIDRQAATTFVNRRMAEMLGYAPEEMIGRPLFDFMDERATQLAGTYWNRRRQGVMEQHPFDFLRKDGTHLSAVLGTAPLLDDRGDFAGAIAVVTDVTVFKRANEALRERDRRLQSVFHLAPVGIGVVAERVFKEVNDHMCELTGYTRAELLERNTRFLFPTQEDYDVVGSQWYAQIRETGHGSIETRWRRKDGRVIDILLKSAAIDAAHTEQGLMFAAQDVSEHKQAEQAIRDGEQRVRARLNAILSPEGDIGDVALGDVLDCEAVQALMDALCRLTNIGMGILDLDGRQLVGTRAQDICAKFHRLHPETRRNCIESDTILARGVAPGTFKLYQCKNHLSEIATPIMVGGKHVGNLFVGQFRFDDEPPDLEVFRRQARQYGFDEQEYLAALDRVPRHSRETLNTAMTFYTKLAGMISQLSHGNVSLARTVTERDRLLESLRESEERYRTIVETANEGICQLDDEYRITYVNRRFAELLGYRTDEMVGRPMTDFTLEEELSDHHEQVVQRRGGASSRYERRLRHKDGNIRWLLVSATPLFDAQGRFSGSFSMANDITERKQAESQRDATLEALRLKSEELDRYFTSSTDLLCIADTDGYFRRLNPAWEQTLGDPLSDLEGRRYLDFVHPDDVETTRIEADRLARQEEVVNFENRYRCRDGSYRWIEWRSFPVGKMIYAVARDITERKRAEAALRESEERYRALVETSPDGIALLDLDGNILMANQRGLAMVGATSVEEILGRKAPDFVAREQRACAVEQLARTLEAGSAAGEYDIVGKGASLFPVDLSSSLVRDAAGQPVAFIGVLRDISERARAEQEKERLQAQLLQAQKMEAVGRLTAGVAHDFNNLLTVMVGFAELMKFQLVAGDPLLEMVDRVLSAGESAANLIRQLMAFSRQQVMQPQLLDLNSELARMERMLHRIIGEDITLEIRPGGDLWPVKADPTQLQQVIANLVVNAREAMPTGGRVDISTTNVMLDDTQAARFADARAGDYVLMRITDTGAGMSRDVQARIFEPFFTTKEHGTGLGLATVFGIVSQSGGFVDLISAEGQGTTFAIYLPRERETAPVVVAAAPVAVAPSGGSETILLLEDSSQVREYAREVLRAQGYTVLEAGHGREALRITEEHVGPIHLLVTDVVMPGMSGRDAAQRLLAIHPGLKILYMSGYTDDVLETHGAFGAGVAFLQKPFGALELVRAVRRILDEEEA